MLPLSKPYRTPGRRFRATSLILVAVLVVVGCSSGPVDGGDGSDDGPRTDSVTTPVPDDEIPVVEGPRDRVVFDRLVADGFSKAEADCLARRMSLVELVSAEPDVLIGVFGSCRVPVDRLIELGSAR